MMQKLMHLELIRGLAAIVVLLSHLVPGLVNYGTEAVAVFFALSGYVMNCSFTRNPRSRKRYLIGRFKRIYPTFLISLLLSFALLFDKEQYTLKVLIGNFLMLGSLGWHVVRLPVNNLALWSITIEMGFYYLFALCIVGEQLVRLRIVCWTIIAFVFMVFRFHNVASFEGLNLMSMVLQFSVSWLVGYWAFHFQKVLNRIPVSAAMGLASLLFAVSRLAYFDIQSPLKFALIAVVISPLLALNMDFDSESQKLRRNNILPWIIVICSISLVLFQYSGATRVNSQVYFGLPVLVTLAFCSIQQRKINEFLNRFQSTIAILGRISFPLYVLHMPIVYLLLKSEDDSWWALCGAVFIIALITFLVEFKAQPAISRFLYKS